MACQTNQRRVARAAQRSGIATNNNGSLPSNGLLPGNNSSTPDNGSAPVKTPTARFSQVRMDLRQSLRVNPKSAYARAKRRQKAANVRIIYTAIKEKRKIDLGYETPSRIRLFHLAPLDIKAGKTDSTRENKYLVAYDEYEERPVSIPIDRIWFVRTAPGSFDPSRLPALKGKKKIKWNLSRNW